MFIHFSGMEIKTPRFDEMLKDIGDSIFIVEDFVLLVEVIEILEVVVQ